MPRPRLRRLSRAGAVTVLESRPSVHPKLVRRAVAASAAVPFAAFIVGLSAVPAFAVTCSGGATLTIGVAGGESIALSLSGESDPLAIVVTPSDPGCGGFDTSTVRAIQVNGTDGDRASRLTRTAAPVPAPEHHLDRSLARRRRGRPRHRRTEHRRLDRIRSRWHQPGCRRRPGRHRDRHGRKLHRRCRRGRRHRLRQRRRRPGWRVPDRHHAPR